MKSLLITTLAMLALAPCVYAKQSPLKKNDRIVFLGDSITAAGARPGGYITLSAEAIAKAYPDLNIELIGAGIGGHKVANCQQRLDKDVLQKKPTIVFIYIGINDVWHWTHPRVVARGKKGTTPEDFESGLRDMIQKINDIGARVILCTPTVIGEKPDGANPDDERLDQYSDISRKVATETSSQLLDLRKGFITYLKEHNSKKRQRGHPNIGQCAHEPGRQSTALQARPRSPASARCKRAMKWLSRGSILICLRERFLHGVTVFCQ